MEPGRMGGFGLLWWKICSICWNWAEKMKKKKKNTLDDKTTPVETTSVCSSPCIIQMVWFVYLEWEEGCSLVESWVRPLCSFLKHPCLIQPIAEILPEWARYEAMAAHRRVKNVLWFATHCQADWGFICLTILLYQPSTVGGQTGPQGTHA